jgi:peptidoglycan-N-acetylglucosamine deacetylase
MSFLYRTAAPLLFPSFVWHTNGPTVHLSFDDGPHPVATPKVLQILKDRGIRATFFLLGSNVERWPEIANAIQLEGHAIGNHSSHHDSFLFKSFGWQLHQIGKARDSIERATGVTPRLFRPPFGRFNRGTVRAVAAHSLSMVFWDVDASDYSGRLPARIARSVCRQTIPGSIVLFHDNKETSGTIYEYLNPILDILQGRELGFSTLEQ